MYTDISKITENAEKGKSKKLTISLYEKLAEKFELEEKDQIIQNNTKITRCVKLNERMFNVI